MNFLVLGKGGREHAVIQALKQSPSAEKVFCLPGREGFFTQQLELPSVQNISQSSRSSSNNIEKWIPLIKKQKIKCAVIGPEQELIDGWSDALRKADIAVFGPSQSAAQLEGSKIFAKKFMEKAGIPTSPYFAVESVSQTLEKSRHFQPPYVLKADGPAGGKGVFICSNKEELKQSAEKLFEKKIFGAAGAQALLEKFQKGSELSVFILTNGKNYCTLPLAQDYKKLKEGHLGPNTGGMGAAAPISISDTLTALIHKDILQPAVQQINKQNLFYRGVLYIGIIITDSGPKVLEYNVRFGDPECQALLPLLDGDAGSLFYQTACGRIPKIQLKNLFSCCVVLTEKQYPYNPQKGAVIQCSSDLLSPPLKADAYFLHAGTKKSHNRWLIDGGRVLNAVGLGCSPQAACRQAYRLAHQIPDLYFRKDIGSSSGC